MTPPRSKKAAPAAPEALQIPPDSLIVMSHDGGQNFQAAAVHGCTVNKYAWPTILRMIAARLEAEVTQ